MKNTRCAKIFINGRFLSRRITGVERYATELLRELDRMARPETCVLLLPPDVIKEPKYQNITVKKVGHLRNRLWEHITLPMYARQHSAVTLNLCNTAPLIAPGICCIHDVKIKARPKDFSRGFRMWYQLLFCNETARCRDILTVSEFSKEEILRYYQIAGERITVVPDAWQHYERIPEAKDVPEKFGLKRYGYYFFMASMEPNKNLNWILEAARHNPNSVFAAAGSANPEVFRKQNMGGFPPNVHLLGYVSDSEAKTLMKYCKAFIFPSFYEGFGIPPMEALSAGAGQVLVSDTQVMHEVFGEGVQYIDPYKATIDFERIEPITVRARQEILSRYSWKHSAEILMELLHRRYGVEYRCDE